MNKDDGFTLNSQWRFSEEEAGRRWPAVGEDIQALGARLDDLGPKRPGTGSPLDDDDAASDPYRVSSAAFNCLTVGGDHLRALELLVVGNRVLHLTAAASLTRGALEALSTGFWILHPAERAERIARVRRWYGQNLNDQARALGERRSAAAKAAAPKLKGKTYKSTDAVSYTEANAPLPGLLFAWQLCSGFAHSRPWATLGWSQRTATSIPDTDLAVVSLTNSAARALYPVLPAVELITILVDLYERRGFTDLP